MLYHKSRLVIFPAQITLLAPHLKGGFCQVLLDYPNASIEGLISLLQFDLLYPRCKSVLKTLTGIYSTAPSHNNASVLSSHFKSAISPA